MTRRKSIAWEKLKELSGGKPGISYRGTTLEEVLDHIRASYGDDIVRDIESKFIVETPKEIQDRYKGRYDETNKKKRKEKYLENRDEIRARNREYYYKNRDRILAKNREERRILKELRNREE